MEFADSKCPECGVELGGEEPKGVIKVKEPYTITLGRIVEYVGPCPSCGKNIPVCEGAGALPGPEPVEPEPAPEPTTPEPEPET